MSSATFIIFSLPLNSVLIEGPIPLPRVRVVKYLQDEFERRRRASEAWDGSDRTALTPEQEEERAAAKRKMVGNLRFIGELGKLEIIHESILHRCIQQVETYSATAPQQNKILLVKFKYILLTISYPLCFCS